MDAGTALDDGGAPDDVASEDGGAMFDAALDAGSLDAGLRLDVGPLAPDASGCTDVTSVPRSATRGESRPVPGDSDQENWSYPEMIGAADATPGAAGTTLNVARTRLAPSTSRSEWLIADSFGFTVPFDHTILGVEVWVTRRAREFETPADQSVQLIINGSTMTDESRTSPFAWDNVAFERVTYGGASRRLGTRVDARGDQRRVLRRCAARALHPHGGQLRRDDRSRRGARAPRALPLTGGKPTSSLGRRLSTSRIEEDSVRPDARHEFLGKKRPRVFRNHNEWRAHFAGLEISGLGSRGFGSRGLRPRSAAAFSRATPSMRKRRSSTRRSPAGPR